MAVKDYIKRVENNGTDLGTGIPSAINTILEGYVTSMKIAGASLNDYLWASQLMDQNDGFMLGQVVHNKNGISLGHDIHAYIKKLDA